MSKLVRHRGLIFKTFLYQVVMSFFGVMMLTATSRNQALMIIGLAASLLFYLYILFFQSMQAGSKSCEYGRGHDVRTSPWEGILPILLGFLPMIALSLWCAFVPPFHADGSYSSSYLPYLLNKLLQQGMYAGIYQSLYPASDDAALNAAAVNHQVLLYPFAFLPGWIAGSAGFAVGWFRFQKGEKKQKEETT